MFPKASVTGSSPVGVLFYSCNQVTFISSKEIIAINISVQTKRLADVLARRQLKIVFAESCTAGLASATLATVPGISKWHCGSAVTYRSQTKIEWLKTSPDDLEKFTAVSEPIARAMATGVLAITPEADIAASITGYLGPNEPPELDGVIYIAVAYRVANTIDVNSIDHVTIWRFTLQSSTRLDRQQEAVQHVFDCLLESLKND